MNSYTRLRDITASHRGAVVGASEIATLALYNLRYGQTPYTLFEEHTGRAEPFAGNEAAWWGTVHEPTILYRYIRDHFDEEQARAFLSSFWRRRSSGPFKVLTEFRRKIQHGTAIAAVTVAWSAAWNGDVSARVSRPERPAQTVTVVPARVPGATGIRPLRSAPPGARHRAGTATA